MALNASTSFLAKKFKKHEKRQSLLNRLSKCSASSSSSTILSSFASSSEKSSSSQSPPPQPSPSKSMANRIKSSLLATVSRHRESSTKAPKPTKSTIKSKIIIPSSATAQPRSVVEAYPVTTKPSSVEPQTGIKRPIRTKLLPVVEEISKPVTEQSSLPPTNQKLSSKPLPSLPSQERQEQDQQLNNLSELPNSCIHPQINNIPRDRRKRLSMYAQQAGPRLMFRRPQVHLPPRPVSQMTPIRHYDHDESDNGLWRRCSTFNVLTEIGSSIMRTEDSSRSSICSLSTSSSNDDSNMSTRSSSISSLPTPSEEHEQPTPVVSLSAMAVPLQHYESANSSNGKRRQRHNSSILAKTPSLLSPTASAERPSRAKSMFVHRKEIKAISVWRDTKAKLSDISSSPPPKPILVTATQNKQNMVLARFVLHELYTTEQSYHRLLTVIQQRYMQPMSQNSNNNMNNIISAAARPLFFTTSDLVPLFFRHLPDLLALSEKVMLGLQEHQSQVTNVGRLFCSLEKELTVFLKYAVHYESNIKSIRRSCATNPLFLKIEQEGISRRETNRMGFADYLIAPFQRVPRYCLLIKDLIKHSTTAPEECPDPDLDKALKMLTSLAMTMNHVQKIPR
ncbi:Dbl homology domain-containing protein [Circinella umbellata]|nr:Dbl homology domain-containing protein [Circinella umbellata]